MGARPLRLLLVDDHPIVLAGLKAVLGAAGGAVRIVGEASDVTAAEQAAVALLPDIVLADLRLPQGSGLDLCRRLGERVPESRVVILTVYDDEQYLYQALRAGAAGYLLKGVAPAELVGHLRRVAAGEVVVDPQLAGRVASSAARLEAGEFWPGARLGLTQRESEVLALLVAGRSNRAIAGTLVVSEETVKSHVSSLYRKLAVADRAGAVATAIREGLFR